jgi:hypothetical protein
LLLPCVRTGDCGDAPSRASHALGTRILSGAPVRLHRGIQFAKCDRWFYVQLYRRSILARLRHRRPLGVWKKLSKPFGSDNRYGAEVSEGVRSSFWLQGMTAGFPAVYFCIKGFYEAVAHAPANR